MTTSLEAWEEALHIVQDMVSTSVREAIGALVQDLSEEFSRYMDTCLRETSQLSEAAISTSTMGRYDNQYTWGLKCMHLRWQIRVHSRLELVALLLEGMARSHPAWVYNPFNWIWG